METSQENAVPVTDTIISYRLTADKVELLLIALYALDVTLQHPEQPIKQTLQAAKLFFEVKQLPDRLEDQIGMLIDELFKPYYEHHMTPWDHLLAVDIDTETISDDEKLTIVRDIERKFGQIIAPEAS